MNISWILWRSVCSKNLTGMLVLLTTKSKKVAVSHKNEYPHVISTVGVIAVTCKMHAEVEHK